MGPPPVGCGGGLSEGRAAFVFEEFDNVYACPPHLHTYTWIFMFVGGVGRQGGILFLCHHYGCGCGCGSLCDHGCRVLVLVRVFVRVVVYVCVVVFLCPWLFSRLFLGVGSLMFSHGMVDPRSCAGRLASRISVSPYKII